MDNASKPENAERPDTFDFKRLLWIPVFVAIVLFLPEPDPSTQATLLREDATVDGLLGGLDSAIAMLAHNEERVVEPTSWQIFLSWFGEEPDLPARPDDKVVFVLAEVDDSSLEGLGLVAEELQRRRWTVESILDHPKIRDLNYLSLVTEAPAGLEATRVRLSIERDAAHTINARLSPMTGSGRGDTGPGLTISNDSGWISPEKFGSGDTPSLSWSFSASPASRYSVLPPLVAIGLALVLRSALISLLGAVIVAGFVLSRLNGEHGAVVNAYKLYEGQVTDEFRITIILFVLFLIGMVGVITRVGGIQGIVNWMIRGKQGPRKTRFATALMGLIIFFDDYSNSVVVGSSMRPLTDKLRIAREKLAYLIDSTAAPIAGIALFSTWIGYEVSQYQIALEVVDPAMADRAYSVFFQTIPLRFYCLFTLAFVLMNAYFSRDFGPMLAAEKRAAETGQVIRKGARPLTSSRFAALSIPPGIVPRARNAVIPIVVVIVTMIVGFWFVGGGIPALMDAGLGSFRAEAIGDILGNPYNMHVAALSAALGSIVAIGIALPKIGLTEALKAWSIGLSSLVFAIAILLSAWALAGACDELHAGQYLVASVGDDLPLATQPLVFFVLACLIAFATGTSWGTMAILIPIAIPLVYYTEGLTPGTGLGGTVTILCFAAVLEGAIFGDHCSPISDTTVLSSVAAGSDHIDHVRTQAPYAITTMLIALLVGYLPVAMGWYSWMVAIPLGLVACAMILFLVGKPTPEADVVE